MQRVALITNVLSHYRIPCFQALSEQLSGQICYFILSQDMKHRRYVMANEEPSFDYQFLRGIKWHNLPNDDRHFNNILPILRYKPEVLILGGWDEPTYLLLWLWGVMRGKKIFFWIESTKNEGNRTGIKERLKKLLLKYAAGCIVPGQRAMEYCQALGVSPDRIHIAPNAINRDFFQKQAITLLPKRDILKNKFMMDTSITILFVGRLVECFKNLTTLFQAVARLQHLPIKMIIVGDGLDRPNYEKQVRETDISNVHFVGTLNHLELSEYYMAADILVLPSQSETWGFVLNEGMEFGLPLIVSDAVGAAPDLVHDGENGFIVPVKDIERLAARIRQLVTDQNLRNAMGDKSREIIQHFSPERWAQGVADAIE